MHDRAGVPSRDNTGAFTEVIVATRRRVLTGLALVVAGAVIAYLGVSWYIVGQALQAKASEFEHHPDDFGMAFEEVQFSPRGEEDITLRGWWFPKDDATATVVWVHGIDSNRANGLPLLRDLSERGFAALAFDLRGHGESDNVPIGAGFFEVNDVRGAIDYLVERRGVEPGTILLLGQSFGAAVAIMGGVGEPAVLGVFADSSFAGLSDMIVAEVAARTPISAWAARLLRPGLVLVADWTRGVEIDKVKPAAAAAQYDYPLRLVHCGDDDRIPHAGNFGPIREASPDSKATLFPGCGHNDAYDDFPDAYVDIFVEYAAERLAAARP